MPEVDLAGVPPDRARLTPLAPGETLELRYRLRATMPLKVQVPAAVIYEYYDPETRAEGGAAELEALGA